MSNSRKKKPFILIEILLAFTLIGIVLTTFFSYFIYNAKQQLKANAALHQSIDQTVRFIDACLSIKKKQLSSDSRVWIKKQEETDDHREKLLVNIAPSADKKEAYALVILHSKHDEN